MTRKFVSSLVPSASPSPLRTYNVNKMSPIPVEAGTCPRCTAAIFVGQKWCQRCFTPVDPAELQSLLPSESSAARPNSSSGNSPAGESVGSGAYYEPDTGTVFISEKSEDADEPNTAQWKAVHLESETWDLSDGGDEPESYPMTRSEIRTAKKAQKKGRGVRIIVLILVILVALGGIGAGGTLIWQRFFELTPSRYASNVATIVRSINGEIQSDSIMVQQISISEVPTASQVIEAVNSQKVFASYASALAAKPAPRQRKQARSLLIAGCREYQLLMGDIRAVGGSNVLVDMGAFNTHLNAANSDWSKGTSIIGHPSPGISLVATQTTAAPR